MIRSLKRIKNLGLALSVLLTVLTQTTHAQSNNSVEAGRFFSVGFSFSSYVPGGDLADRFGNHFGLSISPQFKTSSNWIFSASGQFIFGNDVKQPGLMANLYSEKGELLDEDGQIATILLFQRGMSYSLRLEKVFALKPEKKPNSGIVAGFGFGFVQHKIRIEHQNNRMPQIDNGYEKGYDRLSNGTLLEQNIGYYHISRKKLTNFRIELVFNQGFTQSRRDFNFDDGAKDTSKRIDLFSGLRITWQLPLYRRMANDFYIN
jgi:hypothetical protein